MHRWPRTALRVGLWSLGTGLSGWLCAAMWHVEPPADVPPPPPPIPRPLTEEERARVASLEQELAQEIGRWRDRNGGWPSLAELSEALPDGLLPDNPALPDVGGLVEACAGSPASDADWRYCPQTGQLRAGLPADAQ